MFDESVVKEWQDTSPEQLMEYYKVSFGIRQAQIVLEDLKQRFYGYAPPIGNAQETTDFRVGQQSVIKHIENMINPLPQKEEERPYGR